MALSALVDKENTPQAADLVRVLGPSRRLWEELKSHLDSEYGPLIESWKHSGDNYGWSFQLKSMKRTVLYLTPRDGSFVAGMALGEKAVEAARQSDLPAPLLEFIGSAPEFAEGRPVRIEVKNEVDAAVVKQLAAIKMAN